ncbi:hypothetical protein KO02_21595 [Sphingobacterium sp. ML3W]|uniref:LytR/AlgR family response regulator transcription factor n=1 Tax=Sphingobacterium sp. ML3W TaxID=1538644 RepID=UPI0004F8EC80|nr:response regulator [Sphingobacterium sp. ML3W]AIM38997.1 hypothetical protein KO02_21595 [Sphingobacterium sp. ML3W]
MKLFSTLLIDDEGLALLDIADVLADVGMFDVQASVLSVAEAHKFLIKRKEVMDVIFCDIQMPGCSGLEAVKLLRPYCQYFVFCTGFEQYAMDAHQLLVDGYLLKPVNQLRVMDLTDKWMKNKVLDRKGQDITDHFMLTDLPPPKVLDEHGDVVKDKNKEGKYYKRVEVKDVAYIARCGNYLHFYGLDTHEDAILLGVVNWDMQKLYAKYKAIEQLFPVNQSTIVNEKYIKKVMQEALTVGKTYFSITKIGRPHVDRYLAKVKPNHANANRNR